MTSWKRSAIGSWISIFGLVISLGAQQGCSSVAEVEVFDSGSARVRASILVNEALLRYWEDLRGFDPNLPPLLDAAGLQARLRTVAGIETARLTARERQLDLEVAVRDGEALLRALRVSPPVRWRSGHIELRLGLAEVLNLASPALAEALGDPSEFFQELEEALTAYHPSPSRLIGDASLRVSVRLPRPLREGPFRGSRTAEWQLGLMDFSREGWRARLIW